MNIIKKGKEFVKKHEKGLLIAGGAILGVAITALICGKRKEHFIALFPEIPEGLLDWKNKCDRENLLYNSGLPIFADEDQMIVYRDAIAPEYLQQAANDGFTIIERE